MDIDKMISILVEARKSYYGSGRSGFTDQEYDAMEELLKRRDPNHPFFEKIGQAPSSLWEKSEHTIPMGSLEKVHSAEEFLKWARKFEGEIFEIQYKLDGLSLSLDYEDSVFSKAVTRGDGFIGEDISNNVRLMRGFKETLPIKGFNGSVRAEILLNKVDFDRINAILQEDDKYSNTRNAAAGISRRLDGRFCKYLDLYYYDITEDLDEVEKMKKISFFDLRTPERSVGSAEQVLKTFEDFKEKRPNLPFAIDGVVVKVNSSEIQKREGCVKNKPKFQIAWKFDPPGASTTLESVTWEVGRTGVVTPLGHVDPVEIDGSIISKVTLHNVAEIGRLGIGLGDTVMLVKAGDVIPKITTVIDHVGNPIEIPTHCPDCDSPLSNDGIRLFCLLETCPAKNFLRIIHFIKTVKIDSFGEALAEKLYDSGKIKIAADIFDLKKEDIAGIEGWGSKSADTIIANIEALRTMEPAIFLSSLGIPSLSTSTAEDLWKKYQGIDSIKRATVEDICTIKGYSDISAAKIVNGLKAYDDQMNKLLMHIKLQDKTSQGKFSSMSFCFTGEMSQSRSFFQNIVKKHGGKNDSSVTKTTTYLVCNENRGSSKSRKADQYGVKIINEQQFMDLAGEQVIKKPTVVTQSLFEEE